MTWATWIIAFLCAAAVGSRLGRLTVRPPSLARSSVVIAAVAVAGAATVRTPTLAVIIGPPGSLRPEIVFVGCWVLVAAATAMIAAAAWPVIRRRAIDRLTVVVPLLTVGVIVATAVTKHVVYSTVFIVAAGLFSLLVGVRYIAWHSLGRAIAVYLTGIAVVVGTLIADLRHVTPTSDLWAAAIVILSLACTSVMLESWFLARFDLRVNRRLSELLLTAHPELASADYSSATTVLRADDQVSQILDGLYLHAGAGVIIVEIDDVDALSPVDRARQVARWLHDSESTPIDPDLLTAPDGLSDRTWVRLLAREFNRLM
ncbi:hypothetical protein nbrc107696_05420 [Gordonia spumicola]|uniref:Uncharacterized protein n=1 Tax=Gordonia spumicola TaxID=589161 RepID=A0A7I9V3V5_9ACTN|nr:hypothetical protein [Gordonia spumicola]GEE00096.1 hypothetical protein nbrc107696_05420 [Gordonia spumicola]